MPYPHGPDCRCPQPYGLLFYTISCEHYEAFLVALAKVSGRKPKRSSEPVLELLAPRCDRSMTCQCDQCSVERQARAKRPKPARQPWIPRAAA